MPYLKRDSQELFYRETGEGPLLIIIPGNTSSSACHRGELEFFGRWYRAVSLDLRGTGQSGRMDPWPADWWEVSADDVGALAQHLAGDERASLMGTSGGGVIALKTAIRNPEVVKAVVADSCIGRMPPGWVDGLLAERSAETPEQVGFWSFAHGEDWQPPG